MSAPGHGLAFGRALNLDDPAARRGHHVQVHARRAVFGVAEVERQLAIHVTRAYGSHLIAQRRPRQHPGALQAIERQGERDEATRDRRGPGPAVGLEHVAVDHQSALAEPLREQCRAQRSADKPLNFPGSTAERPIAPVAVLAALRIGARVHLVLCGNPAVSTPLHEVGNALVDRRGAEQDRTPGAVQHRALCQAVKSGDDFHRPHGPQIPPVSLVSRHGSPSFTKPETLRQSKAVVTWLGTCDARLLLWMACIPAMCAGSGAIDGARASRATVCRHDRGERRAAHANRARAIRRPASEAPRDLPAT